MSGDWLFGIEYENRGVQKTVTGTADVHADIGGRLLIDQNGHSTVGPFRSEMHRLTAAQPRIATSGTSPIP